LSREAHAYQAEVSIALSVPKTQLIFWKRFEEFRANREHAFENSNVFAFLIGTIFATGFFPRAIMTSFRALLSE
jgi:hypothetical protein